MVAAIYETVINPGQFDSFLETWAEYVQASIDAPVGAASDPLSDLEGADDLSRPGRDAELQAHFARAYQILEQVGRKVPLLSMRRKVASSKTAMLAIGAEGQVVARSPACTDWLAVLQDADALKEDLAVQSESLLISLLQDLRDSHQGNGAAVVLTTGKLPRHLVARVVNSPEPGGDERLLVIETLDFYWTPQAERMLVVSFGLSPAEVEIVRHLMAGRGLKEIAQETGKSEHTVRNQTNSILSKTGAPGQVELIRLVAFLVNEDVRANNRPDAGVPREESFTARDGRRVQLFRAGLEQGGKQVIFLHGMLDAVAVLQFLAPRLSAQGYGVVAPMRPGFGLSDPLIRPETIMDVVTAQVEELIEREKMDRPVIVGHLAGGIYAHVLAHRLRDKLAGAIAISSGAPIVRLADISSMTARVRVMAYTARFTPSLLPAVLRAGIAMIDSDDIEGFMDAQFPPETPDRAAIRRLGLGPSIQVGYRMSVKQGAVGFASDSYWAVRDWGHFLDGEAAPVIYLHGAEDHVNRSYRIEAAMSDRDGVEVRVCPGVGQLLFYERPELVFTAIEDLLRR